MTQYTIPLADYETTDNLITDLGWTVVLSSAVTRAIVDSQTTPSGKAIQITETNQSIVAPPVVPLAERSWESLGLFRKNAANGSNSGVFFYSSNRNTDGFVAGTRNNTTDQRIFLADRSNFLSDINVVAHGIDPTAWFWQRSQAIWDAGQSRYELRLKTWQADINAPDFGLSNEPSTYQGDTVSSAVPEALDFAFWTRVAGGTPHQTFIGYLSIGWDGSPAPGLPAGGETVEATTAQLVTTGAPASVLLSTAIAATTSQMVLLPQSAGIVLDSTIAAQSAALSIASQQAGIALDVAISAGLASLVLSGQGASVLSNREFNAQVAALTLSAQSAGVTLDTTIDAALGQLVLAAFGATISTGQDIPAALATLALQGLPATVTADVDIQAGTAQLDITGYAGNVVLGASIDVPTAVLEIAGQTAAVISDYTVSAQRGELTIASLPSVVSLARILETGSARLELSALPAGILSAVIVSAQRGEMILAGLEAEVLLSAKGDFLSVTRIRFTAALEAGISLDPGLQAGISLEPGLQATVKARPLH